MMGVVPFRISGCLVKYWSTFIVNDRGHVFVGPRTRTTSEQEERSRAAAQALLIQVIIAVHFVSQIQIGNAVC